MFSPPESPQKWQWAAFSHHFNVKFQVPGLVFWVGFSGISDPGTNFRYVCFAYFAIVIIACQNVPLEPKWPLFWMERAFFWRVRTQKKEDKKLPGIEYMNIYTEGYPMLVLFYPQIHPSLGIDNVYRCCRYSNPCNMFKEKGVQLEKLSMGGWIIFMYGIVTYTVFPKN